MFVQLLKTTPYLSGQHRLDICLQKRKLKETHKNNWDITTSECHLSPLSDGIVFTDSIERPFFSQTYGENLKFLYNQIKDDFFRDVPSIKTKNILYEDNIWIDTTDHTYECGLKRMRYERYKKQFSWLCPLWIEEPYNIDSLYFILTVYGDFAEKHSMKLKITPSDELKNSLKEWLSGVSSNLLYIDIEKERATITGARADSGTPVTADVSYIVPQLLERERPIMETNSTLNQLLSSNCMIARQLVNFNFCFSPEDIIPSHIIKEFTGMRWKITLDAYVNDEMIPKKDFLSNYEFLKSYIFVNNEGKYTDAHNVFDYLSDNKYIDYMYINKTTQVDPYWSLVENPEYIYNFYNGFSSWYGYVDENGEQKDSQVMGLTQLQPDTEHIDYNPQYNNIGWCEIYDYSTYNLSVNELIPVMTQLYDTTGRATKIDIVPKKVCWVNGLKFDCSKLEIPAEYHFKLMMCLTKDNVVNNNITIHELEPGSNVYCMFVPAGGNVDIRDTYKDKLTVKRLVGENPIAVAGTSPVTYFIDQVFPHLILPVKLIFKKSICPILAECPFLDSKEITYIKQEYNVKSHIFRYSGALRPYFIDPFDDIYYNIDYNFKKWTKYDEENSHTNDDAYKAIKEYNKFLNTGYSPIFPSVGYYSLEYDKDTPIDYFEHPQRYNNIECEFSWYLDGRMYVLPPAIETSFTIQVSTNVNEEYIRSTLKNLISYRYGITDPFTLTQLSNLYDYSLDYEYVNDTDIDHQLFKVKYILR